MIQYQRCAHFRRVFGGVHLLHDNVCKNNHFQQTGYLYKACRDFCLVSK